MKVWLCYEYYGDAVFKVVDSEEKAKIALEKKRQEIREYSNDEEYTQDSVAYDSREVE